MTTLLDNAIVIVVNIKLTDDEPICKLIISSNKISITVDLGHLEFISVADLEMLIAAGDAPSISSTSVFVFQRARICMSCECNNVSILNIHSTANRVGSDVMIMKIMWSDCKAAFEKILKVRKVLADNMNSIMNICASERKLANNKYGLKMSAISTAHTARIENLLRKAI